MLLFWPVLVAFVDLIVLAGSMLAAYAIRFSDPFTRLVPVLFGVPPFQVYLGSALVGGAFWVLFMAVRGVYRIQLGQPVWREAFNAVGQLFLGFALVFALLFFYRNFSYSRVVAALTLVIATPLLLVVRVMLARLRRKLFRERPLHNALLVGDFAQEVAQRLEKHAESGICILHLMEDGDTLDPQRLVEEVEARNANTVILAYGFNRFTRARELINHLGGRRLNFLFAPNPQALVTERLRTLNLSGLPMLQLREDPLAGWNGLIKRSFDFIVSLLVLLLFSPLILIVALSVALSSRGPIIFRQTRVGLDGKSFTIFKFRTMRINAEDGTGPKWATPDDPRATPIGRFLRRWSLDEFPQLWNVLRGDMSLVGPRPERPEFVEQFLAEVPRYAERHRVRCGMSGWAQVNGLRGQAPIEVRTRYDLMYIENWSLGLDIWILARTVSAVIFGHDAY